MIQIPDIEKKYIQAYQAQLQQFAGRMAIAYLGDKAPWQKGGVVIEEIQAKAADFIITHSKGNMGLADLLIMFTGIIGQQVGMAALNKQYKNEEEFEKMLDEMTQMFKAGVRVTAEFIKASKAGKPH